MSDRDIYDRFKEIVPLQKIEEMDVIEVENATKIAFKVVNYTPRDFEGAFTRAWRRSVGVVLFEFIFDVYMEDKQ